MDEAARENAKMFDAEEFGALDMEITHIAGQGRMMPEDAIVTHDRIHGFVDTVKAEGGGRSH